MMDMTPATKAEFHKERFLIRFIGLTPDLESRLRGGLTGFDIRSRVPGVVVISLPESLSLKPLYDFLETASLAPSTYSVWASVVSSSDHDGVSLPPYVVEVIRRTQCGVDFSFVACLGSSEDPTDPLTPL
jgi:hypothetical protein